MQQGDLSNTGAAAEDAVYFKFFDNSELSKKRLLYHELYFLSRDEINDPYDINTEKILNGDEGQFTRLFEYTFGECFRSSAQKPKYQVQPFISLCRKSLISSSNLEKLLSAEWTAGLQSCFSEEQPVMQFQFAILFQHALFDLLKSWFKDSAYIISFSRNFDQPLMWSHYANQHRGICLIFSSVNSSIFQDPRYTITILNDRESIGKSFNLKEVKYVKKLSELDGFKYLPGGIYGKGISQADRDDHWRRYDAAFLCKSEAWCYEKEVRLFIRSDVLPEPKIKRMFRFDITQLTGMIFGSKMPQHDFSEWIEIVRKMRADAINKLRLDYLPVFTFYQSSLNFSDYTIQVQPLACLSIFNVHEAGEDKNKLEWQYFEHKRTVPESVATPDWAHFQGKIRYFKGS